MSVADPGTCKKSGGGGLMGGGGRGTEDEARIVSAENVKPLAGVIYVMYVLSRPTCILYDTASLII